MFEYTKPIYCDECRMWLSKITKSKKYWGTFYGDTKKKTIDGLKEIIKAEELKDVHNVTRMV